MRGSVRESVKVYVALIEKVKMRERERESVCVCVYVECVREKKSMTKMKFVLQ